MSHEYHRVQQRLASLKMQHLRMPVPPVHITKYPLDLFKRNEGTGHTCYCTYPGSGKRCGKVILLCMQNKTKH